MLEFKTIESASQGIIIEKKSKFIANIIPVCSKEEAEEKIRELKKKYQDARHNCYAYCVLNDTNKITKSSDDGEPSGTAGIPILKVITENELCNVLIVVTRYFGGILLGTGGLLRAYTDSAKEAIKNSNIINLQEGYEIKFEIGYSDLNFMKYYIEHSYGLIEEIEYLNNIILKVAVTKNVKEEIIDKNSEIGKKIQKIIETKKKFVKKYIDI